MRENVKIIIDSVKTRGYYEKREITRKGGKMARNKLKGRIVEKYLTQEKFAEVIGISSNSMSKKMNGKIGFSQKDIVKWSELLDIDKSKIKKLKIDKYIKKDQD